MDELREWIAQALYVEHSRRYGVALARWSESHPSYYADADAVIVALGLEERYGAKDDDDVHGWELDVDTVHREWPGLPVARRYVTPWERIEEDGHGA